MREVNFSFPHANKASVGITTTLYDRRALDCTSTLPLINSLLHLAYLTTSSARIRSILTVDGGVERLVCILKNGRSKNVMDTWKWNLAFQCVFNIGVRGSDANKGSDTRGSENIRTRVVEADVVPVIATILDNYMQVKEKMLARQDDPDMRHKSSHSRKEKRLPKSGEVRGRDSDLLRGDRRRQAPPPIEILPSGVQPASQMAAAAGPSSAPRAVVLSSPPERTVFSDGASLSAGFENTQRSRHGSGPIPDVDLQGPSPGWAQSAILAPTTQHRTTWSTTTSDLHSVPPMTAGLLAEPPSELDLLPVTPTAPSRQEIHLLNPQENVEQDLTVPTDSDDGEHVDLSRNDTVVQGRRPDIMVNIQDEMDMDQDGGRAALIDDGRQTEARLEGADINMTDADAFNSMNEANATPRNVQLSLTPTMPQSGTTPPLTQPTIPGMFSQLATAERASATSILNTIPKEEDVIMSLHLLAYLSKYCNLRPYFQQSHLVPKLKIGREIQALDGNGPIDVEEEEVDNEFEYCQPDDYNMFPLVEKYTLKHHSQDVRYWACVVMRNLCRKDKSRGDIRQCAYYKCGKWEDYARQFAKCRRCRQTKYCSKECQKSAWVYHRHWCDPINSKDCHESKDGVEAKHDHSGGERATPES